MAIADDQYCGPADAEVAVLVIHGGYFAIGTPEATADSCEAFAARGWRAVNLDYPLGDLAAAARHVEAAAWRARAGHRTVLVYGESAGGGLAALAAARRRVNGAFAWAPVSDLLSWKRNEAAGLPFWAAIADTKPSTLRRFSAATWVSPLSAPLGVVHGRSDGVVSVSQSVRLKRRWPSMTLRVASGGHEQSARSYAGATKSAISYFERLLLGS